MHRVGTPASVELVGVFLLEGPIVTPEKQQQKLAGQSSVARKVFEHVPISEEWASVQVARELNRATGSVMDMRVLTGCLMTLKDAGLVRVSASGCFRREPVALPVPSTIKPAPMKQPNPAAQSSREVSAIDLLAGIAKSLRAVAAEIETAAIAIEESRAKDEGELQKLRQLQALLKGLG